MCVQPSLSGRVGLDAKRSFASHLSNYREAPLIRYPERLPVTLKPE